MGYHEYAIHNRLITVNIGRDLLQAVNFAADKHRDQRRKNIEARCLSTMLSCLVMQQPFQLRNHLPGSTRLCLADPSSL